MRVVSYLELAVALRLLGHVRVERKAADEQHVVPHALHGLLGRFLHLLRADGAVLGADRHGHAPALAVRIRVGAGGVDPGAGVRVEPVERQPLLLLGVLDAGLAQVVEDHRLERDGAHILLGRSLRARALVVGRQHAVRRQALHGERPGHADALVVFVRLVVQELGIGVAQDGRVDRLARHTLRDVRVVRDRLERDVRHALVDEALADVALGLVVRRHLAGQLGFLAHALRGIGQVVPGIARCHDARAGERERHAAGVVRDPAAAPLLGYVGGGAGAGGQSTVACRFTSSSSCSTVTPSPALAA